MGNQKIKSGYWCIKKTVCNNCCYWRWFSNSWFDELEGKEKISNNNKNKNNIELPNNNQDAFDISDNEDEIQDKISDLSSIPNFFEIPKPSGGFKPPLPPSVENPSLKKYEQLDWHKAFPISYNINDNTLPIYINGKQGPNIICLYGAGYSALSFAPVVL